MIRVELATLTRPGPFGPRTIELGDYVGLVDGERLVAMAGERMWATLRRSSPLFTRPTYSSISLGLVPAASTLEGFFISSGMNSGISTGCRATS